MSMPTVPLKAPGWRCATRGCPSSPRPALHDQGIAVEDLGAPELHPRDRRSDGSHPRPRPPPHPRLDRLRGSRAAGQPPVSAGGVTAPRQRSCLPCVVALGGHLAGAVEQIGLVEHVLSWSPAQRRRCALQPPSATAMPKDLFLLPAGTRRTDLGGTWAHESGETVARPRHRIPRSGASHRGTRPPRCRLSAATPIPPLTSSCACATLRPHGPS